MKEGYFSDAERAIVISQYRKLLRYTANQLQPDDIKNVRGIITDGINNDHYKRDKYGINPTIRNLNTAILVCESIEADRNMVIATLLYNLCKSEFVPDEEIVRIFGDDIAKMIHGLLKISNIYKKRSAVESENFRKLLLAFADDIRVILIMIIDRLAIMRIINHHPNEQFTRDISYEAIYLYAPLAHRLGLYAVKSELEDLSLKYTHRDTFTDIANKLNENKDARNKYIEDFIAPVKQRLIDSNIKFEIKGRTKSIHSIWNKMKKQNADVSDIYDLFAIRIIIDTTPEKEKAECWIAYSIITDMFTANPSRMKDWLTIPKSNGYESLHTTVRGPEGKWVEVQIRSRRMDEIAERGLAAHWKYKGGQSEGNLDHWMNNIRDILEAAESGPMEMMKGIKMDIYNKEVFVFTPKGDLYKLPLGATLLDFAFHIHSKLGCACTGGKVDGKHQKLNYKLKSGDTIEVLTSSNQIPKQDWLNFVVTSKARNKIKQTINELNNKSADLGKELLFRRFKNRKIEVDEGILMRSIKKLGYKTVTDFFTHIASEEIDVAEFIDLYLSVDNKENTPATTARTAEEYTMTPTEEKEDNNSDILEIGENLKGVYYKLAKCCNPIYGDDIIGFLSKEGAIKIHRADCSNAKHLCSKYSHRKIDARWSGKGSSQFATTLRIVGVDDIGIVTNITSIISKDNNTTLRNISINSFSGLFQGTLVIGIKDNETLKNLMTKIKNIKGIKEVTRVTNQ
ncbi:MAG: RelA/SpoT family protein [Bacteroidales bacterium]